MAFVQLFVGFSLLFLCQGATWDYESKGPSQWAKLFPTCGGSQQSPINIEVNQLKTNPILKAIKLETDTNVSLAANNNGHTLAFQSEDDKTNVSRVIQNFTGGYLEGARYCLLSFHMHWGSAHSKGSEHTVLGKMYPMELHFVHYDCAAGNIQNAIAGNYQLAVIGVMHEVDTSNNTNNTELHRLLAAATKKVINKGSDEQIGYFNISKLYPKKWDYYSYKGSLTTPGCNEAVRWHLLTHPMKIGLAQLNLLRTLKDANGKAIKDNFRPPQNNINPVYRYAPSAAGLCRNYGITGGFSSLVSYIQENTWKSADGTRLVRRVANGRGQWVLISTTGIFLQSDDGSVNANPPNGVWTAAYAQTGANTMSFTFNCTVALPTPTMSSTFKVDDRVQGNFMSRGIWYSGRVAAVTNLTYTIIFDDGDRETNVPKSRVRRMTKESKIAFQTNEYVKVQQFLGGYKKGTIKIAQRNNQYTVEYTDGTVAVNVVPGRISTLPVYYKNQTVQSELCWWYQGKIASKNPDGSYLVHLNNGYRSNLVGMKIRIPITQYNIGARVKVTAGTPPKQVSGIVLSSTRSNPTTILYEIFVLTAVDGKHILRNVEASKVSSA